MVRTLQGGADRKRIGPWPNKVALRLAGRSRPWSHCEFVPGLLGLSGAIGARR